MSRSVALVVLLLAGVSAGATATPELDTAALATIAQRFLSDGVLRDGADSDVRVVVDALDPRLTFPACDDLKLVQRGNRGFGRTSVTARCDAPRSWAASLTATIEVWRPVAVVVHPLPPQAVVQVADVEMQPRNLAQLNGQFIDSLERVVGWTTRRAVAPGTVLGVRQLVAPVAVSRGDEVKIRSGQGGIAVSMAGTALGSGTTGEQIAVRNLQSSRVVRAWVVGPGLVSTSPIDP